MDRYLKCDFVVRKSDRFLCCEFVLRNYKVLDMTAGASKYSSLFRVTGNLTHYDAHRLEELKNSVTKLIYMETARLYMGNCVDPYKIGVLEIPKPCFGSMSFRVGAKNDTYKNKVAVAFYLKSMECFTKNQINSKKERR